MKVPESVRNKARELETVIVSSGITDENLTLYGLPPNFDRENNPYWAARALVSGILGEGAPDHLQEGETEQDLLDVINQHIVWIQQMKLLEV